MNTTAKATPHIGMGDVGSNPTPTTKLTKNKITMASIWTNVDVDVDVDAQEWFDNAYDDERKDMYEICKEHFDGIKPNGMSIIEEEFHKKLDQLRNNYINLTKVQLNQLMSI